MISNFPESPDLEKALPLPAPYGTFESHDSDEKVRVQSKTEKGDGNRILLSFVGSVLVVGFLVLVSIVGVSILWF